MQHTTTASEAPCQQCRRQLLYAWDEGLLVRADAAPLDPPVAAALRVAGRDVYALTEGGNLIRETVYRHGSLRLVRTRHAAHVCPRARRLEFDPPAQLELFASPPQIERAGRANRTRGPR